MTGCAGAVVPGELLRGVVEQFRPVRVILFGSRARGDARPDSDIDLLVVVDDDLPRERLGWRAVNAARRDYRGDVDIVTFRRSAYVIRRSVVATLPWTVEREGVVVYEGEPNAIRQRVPGRLGAAG